MLRITKFSYDKLFDLLKVRGKDDWQFSFEVGTDFNVLQRMINGRSVPTSVLNRLCDTLGVDLVDIMDHQELKYPSGVSLCDFVREHGFWDDLEDVRLAEIRFRFHEANEIDKIDDLRFLIVENGQSIDDVMAQIIANIDMNPDTNKYSGWIVTDRSLSTVTSLRGEVSDVNSHWGGGRIRGYNMTVSYSLTIEVYDPALIDVDET